MSKLDDIYASFLEDYPDFSSEVAQFKEANKELYKELIRKAEVFVPREVQLGLEKEIDKL